MDDARDTTETAAESTDPGATETPDSGRMRARTWTIAAAFNEPADYDIPPLPEWTVYREADGAMALGAEESDGVFIAAAEPMKIRR